jgi:hypothetical protein
MLTKYWPDSELTHDGRTQTVRDWADELDHNPVGLARRLSKSTDHGELLIPGLEWRYKQPYEVAKRAGGAEGKRIRAENKARAAENRELRRQSRAIDLIESRKNAKVKARRATVRRTLGRQKLRRVLAHIYGNQCMKCGYHEYPAVLEYHHRNPSEKSGEVSKMLAKLSKSSGHAELFADLLTECDKCDLLCPTCHRVVHLKERLTD